MVLDPWRYTESVKPLSMTSFTFETVKTWLYNEKYWSGYSLAILSPKKHSQTLHCFLSADSNTTSSMQSQYFGKLYLLICVYLLFQCSILFPSFIWNVTLSFLHFLSHVNDIEPSSKSLLLKFFTASKYWNKTKNMRIIMNRFLINNIL